MLFRGRSLAPGASALPCVLAVLGSAGALPLCWGTRRVGLGLGNSGHTQFICRDFSVHYCRYSE